MGVFILSTGRGKSEWDMSVCPIKYMSVFQNVLSSGGGLYGNQTMDTHDYTVSSRMWHIAWFGIRDSWHGFSKILEMGMEKAKSLASLKPSRLSSLSPWKVSPDQMHWFSIGPRGRVDRSPSAIIGWALDRKRQDRHTRRATKARSQSI